MLGQGLIPEQYHSIVNMMSNEELADFRGPPAESPAEAGKTLH